MEYIISSRDAPSGSIYEDETYCTRGLCSHPCCWESHIRQTRGFRKYVSMSADSSISGHKEDEQDSDEGLPTQKVLNLLDEYGESSTDLYPSKFRGRPAHLRKQRVAKQDSKRSIVQPVAPRATPSPKQRHLEDLLEPARKPAPIKQVEVQEVFDLDELSQNWDSTFLTKPMYVWIPGEKSKSSKRRLKDKLKSSKVKHYGVPEVVQQKDLTAEDLPDSRKTSHTARPSIISPPWTPVPPPTSVCSDYSDTQARQTRSKSPSQIPTGGQPYRNVGQTPKDRLRYRMIMDELKDLPRPFVIEVMEKTRGMKNKEEILMLMESVLSMRDEGYLTTMRKSDWELSMVTGQVLRQRRLNKNMFEYYERLDQTASGGNQVYKLDETLDDTEGDMTAVPNDVIEGSIYTTAKYKPLPDIGKPTKKKKNSVRVHVATTTQESVKPFHYKRQGNMEFCLEKSQSGNHIAGPYKDHLCKNFMLYQFANDYGLAEPNPSLAANYCDLVCDKLTPTKSEVKQTRGSILKTPTKKPGSSNNISAPKKASFSKVKSSFGKGPRSLPKAGPQTQATKGKTKSTRLVVDHVEMGAPFMTKLHLSVSKEKGLEKPPSPTMSSPSFLAPSTKPQEYKLGPDQIPNLAGLPAWGVNVEGGMKPFFGPHTTPDSLGDSPLSEFILSPTRSLTSAMSKSRPHSERSSLPSARDHINMAADMSVLYDQESLDRNVNNNNNVTPHKQGSARHDLAESSSSIVVPKAPAGTPYTPNTPLRKDKIAGDKSAGVNGSPDAVVLEVIQEATTVDDTTVQALRKQQLSREKTTQSVMEGKTIDATAADLRRVRSANVSRDYDLVPSHRRTHSATDLSLAVLDTASLDQTDQVTDIQAGLVTRATASRQDVVSNASNWPNIDEEALLREQATPKPPEQATRTLSAPDNETTKDAGLTRPATQPPTKQHEKTKIIIDLPAPPPPSPEPSDKPRLSTQHEEESTQHDSSTTASHPQLATAAVIDMSDLSDLPLNNQSDEAPQTVNQSEVDIADNSLSAVPKLNTELTQISQLTEQTEQSVDDAAVGEKEEIRDQMELNVEVKTGQDALSRVPDYQDMDMDREITLSVLPPSALDTPDVVTPAHLRKQQTSNEKLTSDTDSHSVDQTGEDNPVQGVTTEKSLPTVSEIMKPDDEGGLAG